MNRPRLALATLLIVVSWTTACGGNSASTVTETVTQEAAAASTESAASAKPSTTEARGTYELNCSYDLGEGTNDDPAADYRFTAGGDLTNTSDAPGVVEVTYKWRRLGTSAVKVKKTYRLGAKSTREVNITVPASSDDIDAHQDADGKCSAKATFSAQP